MPGDTMDRRSFLAAAAVLPFVSASTARAAQAPARPRLKSLARDALGTTLVLGVPHAPFAGVGYGDDTVIVFVPERYRFRVEEGVSALVHFHGHNSTAGRAIAAHALREQLVDSRQNAVLVVPSSPCSPPTRRAGGSNRLAGSRAFSATRCRRRRARDA
jgi:hypothetical protein